MKETNSFDLLIANGIICSLAKRLDVNQFYQNVNVIIKVVGYDIIGYVKS